MTVVASVVVRPQTEEEREAKPSIQMQRPRRTIAHLELSVRRWCRSGRRSPHRDTTSSSLLHPHPKVTSCCLLVRGCNVHSAVACSLIFVSSIRLRSPSNWLHRRIARGHSLVCVELARTGTRNSASLITLPRTRLKIRPVQPVLVTGSRV